MAIRGAWRVRAPPRSRKSPASPPARSPPTFSTACCGGGSRSTSSSPAKPRIPASPTLADRDRALMRRLVATVLRRLGTLRHLLGGFLEKGFPAEAPRTETILLIGAAQILWLDVPDHAAVDLSVRLAQADRRAARYAGLVNAVLRRVAQSGAKALPDQATRDTPEWLLKRWRKTYGNETARAIAVANGHEPALDLTVKQDAESWAERLRGRVLPTGTVRTLAQGAISLLPGFTEGAWWVQDAAAALPARLLGDVRGLSVADLCAAPGGKTAQLAHAGAHVTAVDRSAARLARLRENLERLSLQAETVAADVLEWQPESSNAVRRRAARCALLLDRHHPPPSRRALAQSRGRPRRAHVVAAAAARPRGRPAQARRHAGLLRLLAGAGGRRQPDRGLAGARSARRPQADYGRRSCSATPNSSPPTATCARCRCIFPIPTRAGAGSMVSMPPGSSERRHKSRRRQAYWPFAGPSLSCGPRAESGRVAGDERLHDAGFGRGTSQALRAHRAPRIPQPARPLQRASAAALALRLGQDRPAA